MAQAPDHCQDRAFSQLGWTSATAAPAAASCPTARAPRRRRATASARCGRGGCRRACAAVARAAPAFAAQPRLLRARPPTRQSSCLDGCQQGHPASSDPRPGWEQACARPAPAAQSRLLAKPQPPPLQACALPTSSHASSRTFAPLHPLTFTTRPPAPPGPPEGEAAARKVQGARRPPALDGRADRRAALV